MKVSQNPRSLHPKLISVYELKSQNKFEKAYQKVCRYVQKNVNDADGWNAKGILLHHNGSLEGSRECYLKACALSPKDDLYIGNLAWLDLDEGRVVDSIERFNICMQLYESTSFMVRQPLYFAVLNYLQSHTDEQTDKVLREVNQILNNFPSLSRALLLRGLCYLKKQMVQEANSIFSYLRKDVTPYYPGESHYVQQLNLNPNSLYQKPTSFFDLINNNLIESRSDQNIFLSKLILKNSFVQRESETNSKQENQKIKVTVFNIAQNPFNQNTIQSFNNERHYLQNYSWNSSLLLNLKGFGETFPGNKFLVTDPIQSSLMEFLRINQSKLNKQSIHNFALQCSQCLQYLHDEIHLLHNQLNSSCIYIDQNFNLKISGFKCARRIKTKPIIKIDHETFNNVEENETIGKKRDIGLLSRIFYELVPKKNPIFLSNTLEIENWILSNDFSSLPNNCHFCNLMKKCCNTSINDRPLISEIIDQLQEMELNNIEIGIN
ncbi:hypothetical protein M0813_24473 [Anaeramoeba flamelloides]|uniref:Protein kinase domain-containing protein n=1 Tax=Anaeramoeba flamelloides TaxID=1746091 RepID=A0ABQ8Y5M3_9EUKA|nr:hypothetical protein M0813_24473 [Anaeramoeba flamelloides]